MVRHFAADGLSRADYLQAVAREPQLANQKAAAVIGNVEAVLSHFAGDGLRRQDYLQAAVDQTILFLAPPAMIIANTEAVAAHLATAEGTPRGECLCRAVDRPRLFSEGVEAIRPSPPPAASVPAPAVPQDQVVAADAQPTPIVDQPWFQELSRFYFGQGQGR